MLFFSGSRSWREILQQGSMYQSTYSDTKRSNLNHHILEWSMIKEMGSFFFKQPECGIIQICLTIAKNKTHKFCSVSNKALLSVIIQLHMWFLRGYLKS